MLCGKQLARTPRVATRRQEAAPGEGVPARHASGRRRAPGLSAMAKISIARNAAHAILLAIEADLGHADDLLRDDPRMTAMSGADRRLTTALVLGVLRWQIQLDESMRAFLAKPHAKLDPGVLVSLRLGAFQLLHLDRIPAHAAIHESVELTRRSGFRSATGLVNAVLRKMAKEPGALKGHDLRRAGATPKREAALGSEGSPASAIAAHPQWMVE